MKNINLSEILEEDLNLKFLSSVYGCNIDTKKTYFCAKNTRQYNRFFYICDGTFYITPKGNKEIKVQSNEFILIPCGIEYKAHWKGENCKYFCVNFSSAGDKCDLGLNNEILLEKDETGAYLSWFKEIHKTWQESKLGYKLHCNAIFFEILRFMYISGIKDKASKGCYPILNSILYLENNYTKDITTDDLAKLCNMSTSNFRRYFRHYSDYPPITYRNILRIKKAAQLLKTNEYSISEAANEVNIDDLYYFSKMFKKVFGVSPKKYV